MARTLHYGTQQIAVRNDSDLAALLERIEKVVNSGKAEWVKIDTDAEPHQLLVQAGIPIHLDGTRKAGQPVRIR